MRILGIDPSSSCTGLALVRGEDMLAHATWKPSKAADKAKGPTRFMEYYSFLYSWISMNKNRIDAVCVEELAVARGFQVVRTLVQFETISLLVPKQHGLITTAIKVGKARNMVLGIPITSTKEECHAALKEQRPFLKLPPLKQGGGDVADAYVMGQVGPLALSS